MKKHWKTINLALWLLALILVVWTLRQLPFDEMLAQLGGLSVGNWLLWTAINLLILYLSVKRWQLLAMSLDCRLSLPRLFRLRQAGSTVSFLTPGPHFGGEPLQLYWLHSHFHLRLHRAAAMLGLDRLLETATNLAVLLAGVLMLLGTAIMPAAEWLQISAILAGLLSLMLVGTGLLFRHPTWLAKRIRRLVPGRTEAESSGREGGWSALVNLLQNNLSWRHPRLWLALLLALAGWAGLLLELLVLLRFLGLSPTLSDVVLIMVGMRLAMLLPAPGGIGTIEASLLWSFSFLGLPMTAAAGLIAMNRLRDAVVLLIGLGCLASFQRPA
ncbi:MAG: lysylphosphatidylglycerol synthase transmembrane domain-containing protein [Gammaproteobacteria bacterium]